MGNIKRAWTTDHGASLVMLSLEAKDPRSPGLQFDELTFPKEPTKEHPLRRVVKFGLLDEDDIRIIIQALGECL